MCVFFHLFLLYIICFLFYIVCFLLYIICFLIYVRSMLSSTAACQWWTAPWTRPTCRMSWCTSALARYTASPCTPPRGEGSDPPLRHYACRWTQHCWTRWWTAARKHREVWWRRRGSSCWWEEWCSSCSSSQSCSCTSNGTTPRAPRPSSLSWTVSFTLLSIWRIYHTGVCWDYHKQRTYI